MRTDTLTLCTDTLKSTPNVQCCSQCISSHAKELNKSFVQRHTLLGTTLNTLIPGKCQETTSKKMGMGQLQFIFQPTSPGIRDTIPSCLRFRWASWLGVVSNLRAMPLRVSCSITCATNNKHFHFHVHRCTLNVYSPVNPIQYIYGYALFLLSSLHPRAFVTGRFTYMYI